MIRSPSIPSLVSVVTGIIVGQSLIFHCDALQSLSWPHQAVLMLLLGALLGLLLILPFRRLRTGLFRGVGLVRSCLVLLALFICSWFLTYAFPIPPAPSRSIDISVFAHATHDDRAKASEVWLRLRVDGALIPPAEWRNDKGWKQHRSFLVFERGRPSAVHWSGNAYDFVTLEVVSHRWSGRATLTVDGQSRELDLYADNHDRKVRSIDLWSHPPVKGQLRFPTRTLLQRWVQFCDAVTICLLILLAFDWLSRKEFRRRVDTGGEVDGGILRETLSLSLPAIKVSAVLLLVFYPGIMTNDSLDQWHQATLGRYADHHPAFHSMAIAAVRLIWDNPAAVAALQALFLALSTGWLIASVRRATNASWTAARVGAWVCALNPIVAMISVTLWKDTPYSAAAVAIAAGMVGLFYRIGPDFRRPAVFAIATAVLVSLMILRHNGPPVAVATILLSLYFVRGMRRVLSILLIASIALFVIMSGPVSRMLHVERTHAAYTVAVHHIGAHLSQGEQPSDTEDRLLLKKLTAGEPWEYNCATASHFIYYQLNRKLAAENYKSLMRISFDMALAHPGTELKHILCVSGLVWRFRAMPNDPFHLLYSGVKPVKHGVRWVKINHTTKIEGLTQSSFFPEAANHIGKFVMRVVRNPLMRPAEYLFVLLFGVVVAVRRLRDWRIAVAVATVPVVHSLVLALANVVQAARYQLPVYVIALATLPCLLTAARVVADQDVKKD